MKRNLFFLLTILLFLNCQKEEPMWFDSQYVFLEVNNSIHNEVIEGKYWGHVEWDGFGYYSYDHSDGTLLSMSWDEVEMTDDTKMILGSMISENGDVSGGYAAALHEIHDLPSSSSNLNITQIDEDGTVYFTYKDSSMVLVPNEEWTKTWTELKTKVHQITDWNEEAGEDVTWIDTLIIQYTYNDRITNWGLLEKSKFTNESW